MKTKFLQQMHSSETKQLGSHDLSMRWLDFQSTKTTRLQNFESTALHNRLCISRYKIYRVSLKNLEWICSDSKLPTRKKLSSVHQVHLYFQHNNHLYSDLQTKILQKLQKWLLLCLAWVNLRKQSVPWTQNWASFTFTPDYIAEV